MFGDGQYCIRAAPAPALRTKDMWVKIPTASYRCRKYLKGWGGSPLCSPLFCKTHSLRVHCQSFRLRRRSLQRSFADPITSSNVHRSHRPRLPPPLRRCPRDPQPWRRAPSPARSPCQGPCRGAGPGRAAHGGQCCSAEAAIAETVQGPDEQYWPRIDPRGQPLARARLHLFALRREPRPISAPPASSRHHHLLLLRIPSPSPHLRSRTHNNPGSLSLPIAIVDGPVFEWRWHRVLQSFHRNPDGWTGYDSI
ncbi:hypothetical protein JB92DRAFT_357879 [Gautieria morchelliformis]|nr:hypothetical protein JB92DRAFT_357879 [Gautieria morchelliformis]